MPLGTTPDNANSGPRGEAKFHLFVETLLRFGEGKLAVTGASMLPAVWPGDVLEVRRQEAAGVEPGDVVLFRREGRLVAHRVVEKLEPPGGRVLITRGDRLRAADLPVTAEELLGRVTAIRRGNRRQVPRLTLGRRVGAWILSRSEVPTRVALRIADCRLTIGDW